MAIFVVSCLVIIGIVFYSGYLLLSKWPKGY